MNRSFQAVNEDKEEGVDESKNYLHEEVSVRLAERLARVEEELFNLREQNKELKDQLGLHGLSTNSSNPSTPAKPVAGGRGSK